MRRVRQHLRLGGALSVLNYPAGSGESLTTTRVTGTLTTGGSWSAGYYQDIDLGATYDLSTTYITQDIAGHLKPWESIGWLPYNSGNTFLRFYCNLNTWPTHDVNISIVEGVTYTQYVMLAMDPDNVAYAIDLDVTADVTAVPNYGDGNTIVLVNASGASNIGDWDGVTGSWYAAMNVGMVDADTVTMDAYVAGDFGVANIPVTILRY